MPPPPKTLSIRSVGAYTPAGTSAFVTAASLRARLQLFEDLPVRDSAGEPLAGAVAPLPARIRGLRRLAALAGAALEECVRGQQGGPLPLVLCAPEPRLGLPEPDAILEELGKLLPGVIDLARSRVLGGGRAGIFAALGAAAGMLDADVAPACYVGGVDSVVDKGALRAALADGRVKTSLASDGFVPGEAAAFCCVSRQPDPHSLATIRAVASADEPSPRGSGQPSTADGLLVAAQTAVQASGVDPATIAEVAHDASGERYAARELTQFLIRLGLRRKDRLPTWTPSISVGETGAAAGALSLAEGAVLLHKKACPGALLMVGGGDGPGRGAAILT